MPSRPSSLDAIPSRFRPAPLTTVDARPDTPSNYPSPGPSPTPHTLFRHEYGLDSVPPRDSALKPWLGLRARLFLSLFSPALIALLFVLAQLLLARADLDDRARDAKAALLSRCRDAENAASYAWSVPHYAAAAVNRQTKESIEASVKEVGRVLSLAIEAIEQTLLFIVNSYRSLFVCFIELLVRGSLSLLIAAVDLLNEAVQEVASGLKTALQASVSGINAVLAATVAGVNDLASIIGKHVNPPQIQMPSLSALDHVSLPSAFDSGLRSLNASLPTLSDLKAKMDGVIQRPFEKLKMDINSTVTGFTFTPTPLTVPNRQVLSFCSEKLDSTPLDDIAADLGKALRIALWIVGLAILFVLIACAVKEWYVWHSLKAHVARTRQAYSMAHDDVASRAPADTGRDSLDEKTLSRHTPFPSPFSDDAKLFSLLQLSTHPLLAVVGLKLGRRLGIRSSRSQARLRWWLAWISHPLAVATLVIGLVGLLSVDLQLMAADKIQERSTAKLNGTFDSLGDEILNSLNSHTQSASWSFANTSNAAIQKAQDELNTGMFAWVNETTSTLNNTLNEFTDGLAMVLNDTFANTPLFTPMQSFISCIIGQKVAGIEKALAWMQSNARANFTLVEPDILMLGKEEQEQMVQPVKQMALGGDAGGGQDGGEDEGIVGKMMGAYRKGLQRQRTMFLVFVGLYLLGLLIGSAIVLFDCGRGAGRWDGLLPRKKRVQDDWYTPYPPPATSVPHPMEPDPYSHVPASCSIDHGISQPLHDDVASLHSRGAPLERKVSPSAPSLRQGLSPNQISRPIPLAKMDEGVPLGALPPSGPATLATSTAPLLKTRSLRGETPSPLPPAPPLSKARGMLQNAAGWWFGWERRSPSPSSAVAGRSLDGEDLRSWAHGGGGMPMSNSSPKPIGAPAPTEGSNGLLTKPPRPLPNPPTSSSPRLVTATTIAPTFEDIRSTALAPPTAPQPSLSSTPAHDVSNLFKPRHFSRLPSRSHPHPPLNPQLSMNPSSSSTCTSTSNQVPPPSRRPSSLQPPIRRPIVEVESSSQLPQHLSMAGPWLTAAEHQAARLSRIQEVKTPSSGGPPGGAGSGGLSPCAL